MTQMDHRTHGGKRPGAGRKPGKGTGRKAITVSVSLMPDQVEIVDSKRGELTRGKWIVRQAFRSIKKPVEEKSK